MTKSPTMYHPPATHQSYPDYHFSCECVNRLMAPVYCERHSTHQRRRITSAMRGAWCFAHGAWNFTRGAGLVPFRNEAAITPERDEYEPQAGFTAEKV
jgi:hypothetical protein